MNPNNQPLLTYLTARDRALALYKGNNVKLDKDVVRAQQGDTYMLALYYAARTRNNNMTLQLYTMILGELSVKKEGKNAIIK
jgi:hypothetical protein